MIKFTSIIPPDISIPDPPDPIKVIGAIVSVFLSILFVGVVLFVCADFILEQLDMPIQRIPPAHPKFDENDDKPQRKRIFSAEEIQSQFRIVSPPDRVWIVGDRLTVLCRWTPPEPESKSPPVLPQLMIDETLVPWTVCFGSNVWFANIPIKPGEHQLRMIGKEITVFVHDSQPKVSVDTGRLWQRLVAHEGTDDPNRCGECHRMIERKADGPGLTVGPLLPSTSCFACHETAKVDRKHAKLSEPTSQDCASCHQLHGDRPSDRKH